MIDDLPLPAAKLLIPVIPLQKDQPGCLQGAADVRRFASQYAGRQASWRQPAGREQVGGNLNGSDAVDGQPGKADVR